MIEGVGGKKHGDIIIYYDEYYIGNIENILEIIELISEYENYDRIALLNELKRIFEV